MGGPLGQTSRHAGIDALENPDGHMVADHESAEMDSEYRPYAALWGDGNTEWPRAANTVEQNLDG